ncbi:hypothetical protein HHK36_014114 [Tetracentron sinense]|uniref:Uncharacterized protein n=1 Tax=Tetracentron sinense TaxID=13715 RepID=A0A834Z7G3_TETSI|nr:hypothetical protein HHK36_014114 [Tetracentron sinense]
MTASTVLARLSARLQPLALKINKKAISSVESSSQSQITIGVEQLGIDDAVAQCNRFGPPEINLVDRLSELGIDSSRHLNAFMTISPV